MKVISQKNQKSSMQRKSIVLLFLCFMSAALSYPFFSANSQTESDADYFIVAEYRSSSSEAVAGESKIPTEEAVVSNSATPSEPKAQNYMHILTVLLLLGVIGLLLVYILYVRNLTHRREQRLQEEVKETASQVGKIFSALRDEIHDQIANMYTRKNLTAKEKEVIAALTEALEVSEILIDKEISEVRTTVK